MLGNIEEHMDITYLLKDWLSHWFVGFRLTRTCSWQLYHIIGSQATYGRSNEITFNCNWLTICSILWNKRF